MTESPSLDALSFSVTGSIARPRAEVYEAVADPAQLSQYFTTGGATGRLEVGADVTWDFADFPGAFPVTVVDAEAPARIVVEWAGEATTDERGVSRTTFEFEPVDDDTRTRVTVTEASWVPTPEGARSAFGNCMGWTGMLAAMKAWLEHGINLRDGFYR